MRSLKRLIPVGIIAAVSMSATDLPVSDPVGVYALIDRVVVEPTEQPKTIQVWGVFALTPGRPGNDYQAAQRGYMYYSVNRRNERATLAEWADLKAVAGTGQPIGFGSRYAEAGRVRRPSEAPANPDTYPLGFGLVKGLSKWLGPTIERELARVPLPLTPVDGGSTRAGQVRLVTRNVAEPSVQYVFDIEGGGTRETSTPMAAGKGETSWTPQMRLRSGERYVWRVWVVQDDTRGQPAAASFRVE
jgi:hypothetical protein